jgi:hypothetical protein
MLTQILPEYRSSVRPARAARAGSLVSADCRGVIGGAGWSCPTRRIAD